MVRRAELKSELYRLARRKSTSEASPTVEIDALRKSVLYLMGEGGARGMKQRFAGLRKKLASHAQVRVAKVDVA